MAIHRVERERPQTDIVIDRVSCDRCGGDLRKIAGGGPAVFGFEGAYVRGGLYPTRNVADAVSVEQELCAACTEKLREWIAAGDADAGREAMARRLAVAGVEMGAGIREAIRVYDEATS